MPYHGHWHQEDPDIGDQVRDVGEVGEGDHSQAFPGYRGIPVRRQWPTSQEQSDGDADAPR